MIKSFKNKETQKVFEGYFSKKLPQDIQSRAFIKLRSLDIAEDIIDLKSPPSNFLEQLSGDREGLYSIRINRQYRICFKFTGRNAYDVEIVDYH